MFFGRNVCEKQQIWVLNPILGN